MFKKKILIGTINLIYALMSPKVCIPHDFYSLTDADMLYITKSKWIFKIQFPCYSLPFLC